MKLNIELTDEEVEAVKDAILNTCIELKDEGEDEDAALLHTAHVKMFGEELDIG